MLRSMTAYGRSLHLSSLGQWLVEVHSVNKKVLDLSLFLPKELLCFDIELRKKLSFVCKRGQVTVRISLLPSSSTQFFSPEQMFFLVSMKKAMKNACQEIGCDSKDITFPFLYELLQTKTSSSFLGEEKVIWEELSLTLDRALQEYEEMRIKEGQFLYNVILQHLMDMKTVLVQLQEKTKGIGEKRRLKILSRLQELKGVEEDQERVLREVFFYVERADITEEMIRLFSHIKQFQEMMAKEGGIGRSLEFLIQEMGREANTISSKSDDIEVTQVTLQIKAEIEKIREQVQNIE